jgi:hypothetical protein
MVEEEPPNHNLLIGDPEQFVHSGNLKSFPFDHCQQPDSDACIQKIPA